MSGLFIKWQDVKNLRIKQVATSQFLLIEVTNPEAYLSTVSGFRQKLLQLNHKTYGTPIAIASNSLVYSFDDLVRLIQARWALYQQSQRTPNL